MTDTDALTGRLYRAWCPPEWDNPPETEHEETIRAMHREMVEPWIAAVLPIVAEEVRKAKAEALMETADWWAANPDDDAFETDRDTRNWLRDVATEYESGGSDEHR